MKGIVFAEFNDMVEEMFGDDMLEDIIDENSANLSTGGAYTSVGTYDSQELVCLVVSLSKHTNIAVDELIRTFGLHLADVFAKKFSTFFTDCSDTFSFLKTIDNHIHVEVHKLYPDAKLPKFEYDDSDPRALKLTYTSTRHLADLAHGLIQGVASYYNEDCTIERLDCPTDNSSQKVEFTISK
ncbi:MAG: heme NO-binding domain-containing protein [Alteromonas sp.]|jgi:hypothetical protein